MSPAAGPADAITIGSPDGATTATFIPSANLVCSALSHHGADWLDPIREQEAAASGKDYGVSLVHPWAGRLARFGYNAAGREVTLSKDDDQLPHDKYGRPIHGVWDRLLQWEVLDNAAQQLVARLSWTSGRLLEVFPFPHELRVTARIETARLGIETELRPTAGVAVPVVFGYHAFLRIPGSQRTNWRMTVGARERMLLDDTLIPTGGVAPLAPREFELAETNVDDDITGFESHAQLAFTDGVTTVSMDLLKGFSAAHLFAPEGRDLVSFEPMTAPANALNSGDGLRIVEPGQTFTTSFAIQLHA